MKKQLLIFVSLFVFAAGSTFAQCNPDLTITTPGIYPDSLTNLDTAYVSQAYSDTIQFKVFSAVQSVTVDSVKILSVTGLPSGFLYFPNPSSGVFPGGSNGCMLIQGNPATAGTFPILVNLRVFGHLSIVPVQVDTIDDDYRIVVINLAGIPPVISPSFEVSQNVPNPFDASTEINFTVPAGGKVQFRLFDLIGKEIITRNIDAVAGVNRNYLSARYLKAGIYFYSVTYRGKTITRKMIVTAKP